MGLTNDVLTVMRADTSQAKQAVKSLRGEERERAKELYDNLQKENAALEASIAKWVKVGVVVASATAAYKGLQHAAKSALEDIRLESAAAGANVASLKDATRGLVEQDKLLEFAGKTMHGTWKLNQQEMELVLHGAMALRKTMGVELVPTIDALTESIAKGNTRALKEFGIEATSKNEVLREMARLWRKAGGNADLAGDDFERATVSWRDSVDNLVGEIGKLVIALQPMFEMLAKVVGLVADAAAIASAPKDSASRTVGFLRDALVRNGKDNSSYDQWGLAGGVDFAGYGRGLFQRTLEKNRAHAVMHKVGESLTLEWVYDAFDQLNKGAAYAAAHYKEKKGGHGRAREVGYAPDLIGAYQDVSGTLYGAGLAVGGALRGTFDQARASQWQTLGDGSMAGGDKRFREEMAGIRQEWEEMQKLTLQAEHKSFLEAAFGPLEDFNAYAAGFQLLTTAATAAFDAWITGSESMGQAIKHAIAEGLRGLAQQMLIESLKHGAYALGSLAFFDFRGAATHAAAAAAFGAGALAAGVAARELGAGGGAGSGARSSAGGAYAAAAGAGGGGGSGGRGEQTTIIYLAPDWSDETPTQRKQKLARAVRDGAIARTSNIVIHH